MAHIVTYAPARALLPPAFATTLGHTLLGLGFAGLGVLALIYRDFALQWQPVPEIPAREAWALANGVVLIAAGVAVWVPRTRFAGASVLAAYLLVWALGLHLPRVIGGVEAAWNGMAEAAALAGGAWVIAASSASRGWFAEGGVGAGRLCFAVSLPVFGVAHFLYADFTASMIPAWIPASLFWAYFTGAGHVAAGVSVLTKILPRLGATLWAVMVTGFVVLLHVPRTFAAPTDRVEWTMLCIATALCGAGWAVAGSLKQRSAL